MAKDDETKEPGFSSGENAPEETPGEENQEVEAEIVEEPPSSLDSYSSLSSSDLYEKKKSSGGMGGMFFLLALILVGGAGAGDFISIRNK